MTLFNYYLRLLFIMILLLMPLQLWSVEPAETVNTLVNSVLTGKITDENGEPVGFVNILVQEARRSIMSDDKGNFTLSNLPNGKYNVRTFRIGYQSVSSPVVLMRSDTTQINLVIKQTPLLFQDVVVESSRDDGTSLNQPAVQLSDKSLHKGLGATIAETINFEPGISQRTMGPAPARPVMRGLGGDRLMLLEDNETTGDLSATSADHAVVIEPMTAERIEVIRGPEAMVYGSNVLGGVINIVRGYIPLTISNNINGSASMMGESVNHGIAGGGDINLPKGPFTLRLDGSVRNAGNTQTPVGELANTSIQTLNGSAGLGLVQSWGNAGAAASIYHSSYGIPPDPNGGHSNGVNINMERQHFESRIDILPRFSLVQMLELRQTYNRYFHEEIEAAGNLGMNFGVVTQSGTVHFHLKDKGVMKNSLVGFKGDYRDYRSGGLSFTPATIEYSGALFVYNEIHLGKFLAHGAVRYDIKKVNPEEDRYSRTVGHIRDRQFDGAAASVSMHYRALDNWLTGYTLTRTFRAPGVEELFSEGPHLAAYSYDIGSADLGKEIGNGMEVFVDYSAQNGNLHLAIFQNSINNYLIPVNTGERSWRRADLFVYRYLGQDVLMRGIEAVFNFHFFTRLALSGSMGYVYGNIKETGNPVPRIPPLEGKLNIQYSVGQFMAGIGFKGADKQTRLGEFENATAGFLVTDIVCQYNRSFGPLLHTVTLSANNLFNTEYRQHLNRVKEILPEPGRNIKLLYKVFF